MNILKELYAGHISPEEQFGYPTDTRYLELSKQVLQAEETLLESLDEKEQKVFAQMKQNNLMMINIEMERMFLYAFKMGFHFSAELFSED